MINPQIKDQVLLKKSSVEAKIETEVSRSVPLGMRGHVPFISQDNTRNAVLSKILRTGEFVENSAELSDSQSRITTMATVFNEWHRFSHDGTVNQPANSTELTAWSYDSTTDSIKSTTNSVTYIGFTSDTVYDKYLHEARLSSTDSDDDVIGLVVAFAVDANGREHTLSALRSTGGVGFTWRLVYNYNRADAKVISDKTGVIKWGNGAYGADATAAAYTTNQALGGWDDFPTGTLVKVTRDADIVKAITTDLGSNVYVATSEIIVDLNSDPVLAIFRGPRGYGFSALSQASSTFKVLQFSETANIIYDVVTGKVYIHNGTSWVEDTTRSVYKDIGIGRLLYNDYSKKIFFVEPDKVVKVGNTDTKISLTEKGVANGVATLDGNTRQPISQLPVLPSFHVTVYPYNTTTEKTAVNGKHFVGGGTLDRQTILHNTGSHFNGTNGRFTAPVTGRYTFSGSLSRILGNAVLQFYKNGAAYGINYLNYGNDWQSVAPTIEIHLVAGDYIQCEVRAVNDTQTNIYSASFSGHMHP